MNMEIAFRLALTVIFFLIMIKMQLQIRRITLRMETVQRQEAAERALVIKEVITTAEALARKAALIAESVKEEADTATAKITRAIIENTEITRQADDNAQKAFHEANQINVKIATLGLEQNTLLKEQVIQDDKDRAQADSIQETGEDSNRMLKDESSQ